MSNMIILEAETLVNLCLRLNKEGYTGELEDNIRLVATRLKRLFDEREKLGENCEDHGIILHEDR